MAVQYLFYPRTLKCDWRLDVTEHAGQRKDGLKGRTEKNEDMRALTQNTSIIL